MVRSIQISIVSSLSVFVTGSVALSGDASVDLERGLLGLGVVLLGLAVGPLSAGWTSGGARLRTPLVAIGAVTTGGL